MSNNAYLSPTSVGPTQPEQRSLSGRLGPGAIILMILAAAAPLTTVSASVPVGLTIGNGAAFPAMYAIAAVILAFFAVGYSAMTPFVTRAGAFYSYITDGLGRRAGLSAAFLALATYTAVQVAVHAFMGVVMHDYILSLAGADLPWWFFSALSVLVTGIFGYRNIELSGKVLGFVLIAEIAICLVFAVVVVLRGGTEAGLSTAALDPAQILSGSPALALMFAISGFLGFEAAAIYRDEARDPLKTVPRATYGALAVIGVFYALTAWAMISAWGDVRSIDRASSNPSTMFLDSIRIYLGTVGEQAGQYLLIGSVFAGILSFHNVIARYVFALANSGALPAVAGRSHHRHRSPHVGSLAQTASATLLLAVCAATGLDPMANVFTWFVGFATVGVLVLMLATCAAVFVFFSSPREDQRRWNTRVAPLLGFAGLGLATFVTVANFPLLMGSEALAWVAGALLVVTAAIGYLIAVLRPAADANALSG